MSDTKDGATTPSGGSGTRGGSATTPNPNVKPPAFTVYKKGFTGSLCTPPKPVKKP